MDYKRLNRRNRIHIWILTILTVILLIQYSKETNQFFLFLCLCCSIFMLFYMTYGVSMLHKRQVKKMSKAKGTYYVEIKEGYIFAGNPRKEIDLSKCKVIWIHSDRIHILQVDHDVFILPVRIMTEIERNLFQDMIKKYCKKQIFVTINDQ